MARRYIEKYWSSVPLEDNSVHLIPRIGVMTPAMIPPLKQSQRLRRELLYMPIDRAREKGTLKNFLIHPHYFLQTLVILTLVSEALLQAPHWYHIFFSTCLKIKISYVDDSRLDKHLYWQSGHHQFGAVCGDDSWAPSSRTQFHSKL